PGSCASLPCPFPPRHLHSCKSIYTITIFGVGLGFFCSLGNGDLSRMHSTHWCHADWEPQNPIPGEGAGSPSLWDGGSASQGCLPSRRRIWLNISFWVEDAGRKPDEVELG
uniref:Uncharacterized protein n=1 Tax=Serinus canaria TaxID=9135 RepID=A0A8C9MIN1_SERCA